MTIEEVMQANVRKVFMAAIGETDYKGSGKVSMDVFVKVKTEQAGFIINGKPSDIMSFTVAVINHSMN